MKKLLFILLQGLLVAGANAQARKKASMAEEKAPYLSSPTLPPLNLLQLDSVSLFTKDSLIKNQKTLLFFFSPTCDHCQHQTEDMLGAIDKFTNIQIVMATYQPLPELREFYKKYNLAVHPSIKVGRDTKFMLPPFYKMKSLPYQALYNEKGELITTFEGNVKIAKLLQEFAVEKNTSQ
jgi:thiol-disulfide isomerase/thioredoxin